MVHIRVGSFITVAGAISKDVCTARAIGDCNTAGTPARRTTGDPAGTPETPFPCVSKKKRLALSLGAMPSLDYDQKVAQRNYSMRPPHYALDYVQDFRAVILGIGG